MDISSTNFLVLLLILFVLGHHVTGDQTTTGEHLTVFRGRDLYAIRKPYLSWEESDYICRNQLKGNLVSIHNTAERSALIDAVTAKYGNGAVWSVYIGLQKNYFDSSSFSWSDGSNVDFLEWSAGEPNDIYELCTEMYMGDHKFNDVYCDSPVYAHYNRVGLCLATFDDCGWKNNSFGAPKPNFTTTWNNNDGITFTISMKNHPQDLVWHYISFKPLSDNDFIYGSSILDDLDEVYDWGDGIPNQLHASHNFANNNTITNETYCDTTYSITLNWTSPFISQEYDSRNNKMILKATAYAYYVFMNEDNSTEVRNVMYSYQQVVNAHLVSDATSVFDSQQLEILRFSMRSISQVSFNAHQSSLSLSASLRCDQKYSLWDIQFVDSSEPLLNLKEIIISKESPGNYKVDMLSSRFDNTLPVQLNSQFVIRATVINSETRAAMRYDIPFNVYYDVITPPPVIDVTFTSQITLKDGIKGSPKSVFKYGESAYVVTGRSDLGGVFGEHMQLAIRNAYVCCAINSASISYLEQSGCAAYDPSIMSEWFQLVRNGIPNSFSTIHITSSVNETIFSFKVDEVAADANRACVVHVNSILKQISYRRMLTSTTDVLEESNTMSQFKVSTTGEESLTGAAAHGTMTTLSVLIICIVMIIL